MLKSDRSVLTNMARIAFSAMLKRAFCAALNSFQQRRCSLRSDKTFSMAAIAITLIKCPANAVFDDTIRCQIPDLAGIGNSGAQLFFRVGQVVLQRLERHLHPAAFWQVRRGELPYAIYLFNW